MTVERRPPQPDATPPARVRTRTTIVATLTARQIQLLAELRPTVAILIRVRELPPDAPTRMIMITHRQRQVLDGLARGESSKEIGRALGVSPRTIDGHVLSLMRKLNVHSRYELVGRARALIPRQDVV